MKESELQTLMSASKTEYERLLLTSSSTGRHKIFRYLHSLCKSSIPSHVTSNGSLSATPYDKVQMFNNHFHSIYQQSTLSILDTFDFPHPTSNFTPISCSEERIYSLLNSLDPCKAAGIDDIGPKVLKSCALSLCRPICLLFQSCLTACRIPLEWKTHLISPIPKSGDPANVANYRPIALLCTTSKLFEKLIFDSVLDHTYHLISKNQFGFVRGRCQQQLLITTLLLIHNAKAKIPSNVLYLDFSKAFDSVPHGELVKLWNIGVTGPTWFLIKQYLQNRVQIASIDGIRSSITSYWSTSAY